MTIKYASEKLELSQDGETKQKHIKKNQELTNVQLLIFILKKNPLDTFIVVQCCFTKKLNKKYVTLHFRYFK